VRLYGLLVRLAGLTLTVLLVAAAVVGAVLRVDVVGAPEDGGDVVAGDPHRARIVEHLLRRGAAHAVDQEFQGGPGLTGPPVGLVGPAGRRMFPHTFH
jgi:hypothetical protein